MPKPKTDNPNPDTHDYCGLHSDWVPIYELVGSGSGRYRHACRSCWSAYMRDRRDQSGSEKQAKKLAVAEASGNAERVQSVMRSVDSKVRRRSMQQYVHDVHTTALPTVNEAVSVIAEVCLFLRSTGMFSGIEIYAEKLVDLKQRLGAASKLLGEPPEPYGGSTLSRAVPKAEPIKPPAPAPYSGPPRMYVPLSPNASQAEVAAAEAEERLARQNLPKAPIKVDLKDLPPGSYLDKMGNPVTPISDDEDIPG